MRVKNAQHNLGLSHKVLEKCREKSTNIPSSRILKFKEHAVEIFKALQGHNQTSPFNVNRMCMAKYPALL